jgi:hypothetical protein
MESLAARVADGAVTSARGIWQRHAPARSADSALDGRLGYGRWGTAAGFPVLYLGAPTASVVVEAYRHLVDPVDDPALRTALAPRVLVTCTVGVDSLLDLRSAGTRNQVGLTIDDVQSETWDKEAYARCQQVAEVAHQLGRHGILTPAATRMGETLALFMDLLTKSERPVRTGEDRIWTTLPDDPRASSTRPLRLVRGD